MQLLLINNNIMDSNKGTYQLEEIKIKSKIQF